MSPENLLAIDCGSQSVRALLFDPRGALLAKQRIPIEPYFSTTPGWAEQDPLVFWQAVCQACQGLWAQPGVDKSSIAGVALTGQRATVVNVDPQGRPLRPAIVWPDQRRTEGQKPVGGLWGLAFAVAGASETVAYLQAEAEANWLRTQQPEVWRKTYKYLLLSGYLTFCLTGRFVDSVGCQAAYVPFDYRKQAWAGKSDWKWQAVPMDPALLPDLIPPAGVLGQVTPQAASESGIPAGLPLIAAAGDKACEVIGAIRQPNQVRQMLDAQANAANGVLLRIRGRMPAGGKVGNEQRPVRQLHRLAITVRAVHQKTVILGRGNPRLAAVPTEDRAEPGVTRRVGPVQAQQCAVPQYVKTRREHSHTEGDRRSPAASVIA